MPKTVWCLFFTLIAWWWPSQTLETGTATSTDSWRDRVCMNSNTWAVSTGTEMHWFLPMCIHVLFCCFSGVWILVWPCEQLVEEETDLLKHPLHVLRRHDRGMTVVSVGSFCRVNSPLAGIIQWYQTMQYVFKQLCLQDTGREIDKLCSFLCLSLSAEERKQILYGVQFDNMKRNKMANYSTLPIMDFKISPFMRKGNQISDWMCVTRKKKSDVLY